MAKGGSGGSGRYFNKGGASGAGANKRKSNALPSKKKAGSGGSVKGPSAGGGGGHITTSRNTYERTSRMNQRSRNVNNRSNRSTVRNIYSGGGGSPAPKQRSRQHTIHDPAKMPKTPKAPISNRSTKRPTAGTPSSLNNPYTKKWAGKPVTRKAAGPRKAQPKIKYRSVDRNKRAQKSFESIYKAKGRRMF